MQKSPEPSPSFKYVYPEQPRLYCGMFSLTVCCCIGGPAFFLIHDQKVLFGILVLLLVDLIRHHKPLAPVILYHDSISVDSRDMKLSKIKFIDIDKSKNALYLLPDTRKLSEKEKQKSFHLPTRISTFRDLLPALQELNPDIKMSAQVLEIKDNLDSIPSEDNKYLTLKLAGLIVAFLAFSSLARDFISAALLFPALALAFPYINNSAFKIEPNDKDATIGSFMTHLQFFCVGIPILLHKEIAGNDPSKFMIFFYLAVSVCLSGIIVVNSGKFELEFKFAALIPPVAVVIWYLVSQN